MKRLFLFAQNKRLKPINSDKICAVVVTFHPSDSFPANLGTLAKQCGKVIVVDNGSSGESVKFLLDAEAVPGIKLIRNGSNLGIAAALNIGIKRALADGYDWIATFDQDSNITPGFFSGLLGVYQKCPNRESVAVIAPQLFYPESNESELNPADALSEFVSIRSAITSGSLIRAEVFAKIGYYDEPMFIDYVDYDFCLRMQKAGWQIIRANHVLLHHRLGAAEKHSFLGREISIKSHSAWRRYYITRNRVIVYRRYGLTFPAWCLHDFGWFFLELGKVLVFEKDKPAKLKSILKGLWHGIIYSSQPSALSP